MKKINIITLAALVFSLFTFSSITAKTSWLNKVVEVSTSERDAEIYVNGKLMGQGSMKVLLPKSSCVNVEVKKIGYLTEYITFCNQKTMTKPPKSFHFQMKRDDAYDATTRTDVANVDLELTTSRDELKTWRLISQIITSYFDIIEITDRETGYLRTAWSVKSFAQSTVRTRVILKLSNTEPLTYKVKLNVEIAPKANVSVKRDEWFREWDRVIKKHEEMLTELQVRL